MAVSGARVSAPMARAAIPRHPKAVAASAPVVGASVSKRMKNGRVSAVRGMRMHLPASGRGRKEVASGSKARGSVAFPVAVMPRRGSAIPPGASARGRLVMTTGAPRARRVAVGSLAIVTSASALRVMTSAAARRRAKAVAGSTRKKVGVARRMSRTAIAGNGKSAPAAPPRKVVAVSVVTSVPAVLRVRKAAARLGRLQGAAVKKAVAASEAMSAPAALGVRKAVARLESTRGVAAATAKKAVAVPVATSAPVVRRARTAVVRSVIRQDATVANVRMVAAASVASVVRVSNVSSALAVLTALLRSRNAGPGRDRRPGMNARRTSLSPSGSRRPSRLPNPPLPPSRRARWCDVRKAKPKACACPRSWLSVASAPAARRTS